MWYKQSPLVAKAQHFNIIFHDVNGMTENADVRTRGVKIGCVDSIKLIGNKQVVCAVRIKSDSAGVPCGSKFEIVPENLVGARYVEVTMPANDASKIADGSDVMGSDPLRPERTLDKVARALSEVDFQELAQRSSEDLEKISRLTDNLSGMTGPVRRAADRAPQMEAEVAALARELRSTTRRIRQIVDNPGSGESLRTTAQSIQSTMHELNQTLSDKELRQDIKTSLSDLKQSSASIERSAESIAKLGADQGVRSDLKDILNKTRQVVTQVDGLINKPDGNPEFSSTLKETRDAIHHLDLAAQQINQILDRKHPLVHMVFGRPGHIEQQPADGLSGPSVQEHGQTAGTPGAVTH
jgi:phospholipid/cholesterol/gamma-HCH transport system substrate-binding protein